MYMYYTCKIVEKRDMPNVCPEAPRKTRYHFLILVHFTKTFLFYYQTLHSSKLSEYKQKTVIFIFIQVKGDFWLFPEALVSQKCLILQFISVGAEIYGK